MLSLNNSSQVSATPLKTKRADELGIDDRIVITRTDASGFVQIEICTVVIAISDSEAETYAIKLRVRPMRNTTAFEPASHVTFDPVTAYELETITFAAFDTEVTVISQ